MSDWEHDELVEDLLRNRWETGVVAASEVSLGPKGGVKLGTRGQADILAIRKSWTKPMPTVYEVKATRSDLLKDLRTEKWKRYLPWCDRLYFAAPRGVAEKDDMPKGIGLYLRNENGWYSVKAGRMRYRDEEEAADLQAVAFAILLSLMPSPWKYPHPDRVERLRQIREGRKRAKAFGKEVAEKFRRLEALEDRGERCMEAFDRLVEALRAHDQRQPGSRRVPAFGIRDAARRAAEIVEGSSGIPFNETCEIVQEAMPLHHAFDPMSLPAHVGQLIRERDRLRERVEELEGED